VLGEVSAIIEELAARLRDRPRADWDVAELDRLRRAGATRDAGAGLTAQVVRLAREASPTGTIATVDAGPYAAGVATAWHATAPREFLSSSSPANPGFALPAAIAALLAHPDRRAVCFTDARELAAEPGELATAAQLGARIAIVAFGGGAESPPEIRQAESLGVPMSTVHDDATFARAFGRALAAGGPSLLVVRPR
jgi:acetolactate synthase-1/2/3 large subunit